MILIAGCSSMQPQSAQNQMSGMMCDKCQTVWFPKTTPGGKLGNRHFAYRGSRRMICPECESIAATFFRTGRFTHVCPGCRGNMTRCTAQLAPQQASGE